MICKKLPTKIEPLSGIQIFVNALCNLRCTYCYICKDDGNVLKQIDKDIKLEWDSGVYEQRIRDEFSDEDKARINRLSLWGGETLMGIDRAFPHFKSIYKLLPNLNYTDISTNFAIPSAIDVVQQLIDTIHAVIESDKTYTIDMQISIDGPAEITDMGRGKGTTKLVIENFHRMLKELRVPKNIYLSLSTKPTLSVEAHKYLQTDDQIKKYYEFFSREFYVPFVESGISETATLFLGIPNWAEPYEYTKQDGLDVAEIFRRCQKLSDSADRPEGYGGNSLVPYASRAGIPSDRFGKDVYCFSCGGLCGQVHGIVCLSPNGSYSVCHRGLFDSYLDYCKVNNNPDRYLLQRLELTDQNCYNWDLKGFKKARETFNLIYRHPSLMFVSDITVITKVYSRAGIIDKKYLTDSKALEEAVQFIFYRSQCPFVSMEQCGSPFTISPNLFPLFLNGAFDVISEEIKKRGDGR